jgi:hypothetical protein
MAETNNAPLRTLFRSLISKIKTSANDDYRKEQNKIAEHFITVSLQELDKQIDFVHKDTKASYIAKYNEIADTLATFNDNMQSSGAQSYTAIYDKVLVHLRKNAPALYELGVNVGHVESIIVKATKVQFNAFRNAEMDINPKRNTPKAIGLQQGTLTDDDRAELTRVLALMAAYTNTLQKIDSVQDGTGLITLLRSASKDIANVKVEYLRDLNSIKQMLRTDGDYYTLATGLLRGGIAELKIGTTIKFVRSMEVPKPRYSTMDLTLEVEAFNTFKGRLQGQLKQNLINALESKLADNPKIWKSLQTSLDEKIKHFITDQEFLKIFPRTYGSKTIIEAAVDVVTDAISGEPRKPYKAKSPKQIDKADSIIRVKVPDVKIKTPKFSKFNNAVRNLNTGQFTSISSLKALLNSHLHDVVAANMGDGNQRRILNYRTGRFATSTFVERVTLDRQSMVDVYYNYMKNPYATFSEGGKQQYPRTRDPKILISKSIREIAQTMGVQRMRTILV